MPPHVDTARSPQIVPRRAESFRGWLVDAISVALVYIVLLAVWGRPVGQIDLLAVGAVMVLSAPGSPLFHGLTGTALMRLVIRWGLLFLVLGGLAVWGAPWGGYEAAPGDRNFMVLWGLGALSAMVFTRLVSPMALRASESLSKTRSVVIVGTSDAALRLGQAIAAGQCKGQVLAGYFDDRTSDRVSFPTWGRRLGGVSEVGEFVKRHGIDCVYIALPLSSAPRMLDLVQQTQDTTASVYLVPNVLVDDLIQARFSLFGGIPTVAMCESPFNGVSGVVKRALDLAVTLAALPVLLPAMGVIAVLVRATSKGPAIFKQRRYGLDGKEIVVLKFRTMRTLEDGCTSATYQQVKPGDDRVTPLGRFLRRTSLDELPQFLNVLFGTMSIVGPRPHALAVNEECRKLIPRYMLRHKVKPGITGWAQVNGCRGGDDLEALRRRTECDIQYLKSWSLGLDLLIMWRTALLLVGGDKNAY